jgi:hypothetical protein
MLSPLDYAAVAAMSSPGQSPRGTPISVRRFESFAEADRHDLEFWQQLSDADRILQVWRLSREQWMLRGENPDEPGLCRSVARVQRR